LRKKILALFALLFCYWTLAAYVQTKANPLNHNHFDQHTRQALAWIDGQLHLNEKPGYLELVTFNEKTYNSFPATPSLVEIPLVLLFGKGTPNNLVLFFFCFAALIAMIRMAKLRNFSEKHATILAMTIWLGTNAFYLSLEASVWNQGQIMGFCFAIFGFHQILMGKNVWLGYFFLSLAVGCRPFYLFYLPIFVFIDHDKNRKNLSQIAKTVFPSMAPMGIFLATLNYLRFGDIFEFGHKYLPHSIRLPNGVFSFHYLQRNLWHAWIEIPKFQLKPLFLAFDGRGTAFWINNGIVLVAALALIVGPVRRSYKIAILATALTVWAPLLLHESNGWYQFGYRYIVDLLPLAFIAFIYSYGRMGIPFYILAIISVIINFYGAIWIKYSI